MQKKTIFLSLSVPGNDVLIFRSPGVIDSSRIASGFDVSEVVEM